MRNSLLVVALLSALALPGSLRGQNTMPLLNGGEPSAGTIGDLLTATGANLGQEKVAALYLTDGKNDVKVVITGQSSELIKFKIPSGIKAGRFALLILTTGQNAALIEEPVKVTVELPGSGPTS
jgi:hypothetical protein